MRPLFHPAISDVTVEEMLYALSDPVRAAMFAEIVAQECPQSCSSLMAVEERAIPKSTLSQHFKVLRDAGLIRSERHGVEVRNVSRAAEWEGRFPGLLRAILTAYMMQAAGARTPSKARRAQKLPTRSRRSSA
jgi:DNA-binding transcriptional ArsR family regulator